ncbi:endonuclease/exonuclease/phosphatase family protein [[Phormidium] sp. ETS-05]|uniref:endonuclease/exonuclease/phosphatase family protein n=1 Tax=[Phormidium] sp. ETS-05 TaxID=222819 RepID=UPI0018EF3392|nr:endonuclease/exonuclease/phosphatase family protein [[Phormidium] sp. ETS-05]
MQKINPFRLGQQIAQIAVLTYSALIIAYLLLRGIFWDKFWLVGLISSFIPWIFLPIFLIPIVAFGIIQKKWLNIASCIACFLLISWMHIQYFSPSPPPTTVSPVTLKVLSLNNSWHKTPSDNLVNLILTQQPDIVCLQEVTKKHHKEAFPQLKPFYHIEAGPGVVVLSKYPILSGEDIKLGDESHRESQQRVIIQLNPQQQVVVYNVATSSPWVKFYKYGGLKFPVYEYGDRSVEIADLVQRLQKEQEPVVLAGDLNMTDQSQDYHQLRAVMRDTFAESGWGFGFTWPDGWDFNFLLPNSNIILKTPLVRVDYIWHSHHWVSAKTEVLPTTGSDHLPLVTQLHFLSR